MGKRVNLNSLKSHSFRCIRTNSARACFETWFIHIKSIGSLICKRNRGISHQNEAQLVCRHITNHNNYHMTQHFLVCYHESFRFPWTQALIVSAFRDAQKSSHGDWYFKSVCNVSHWTQNSHWLFNFRDHSYFFNDGFCNFRNNVFSKVWIIVFLSLISCRI